MTWVIVDNKIICEICKVELKITKEVKDHKIIFYLFCDQCKDTNRIVCSKNQL